LLIMVQHMMTIDNCKAFYDSWQMECCGTPFAVGDKIKWLVLTVEKDDLFTSVDLGNVDYCYEAHSSQWQELSVLEGTVGKIEILYQKYEPSQDNPRYLVPVGGELISTDRVQGFEKDSGDLKVTGYLVALRDCTLRPAKQEEVTFK